MTLHLPISVVQMLCCNITVLHEVCSPTNSYSGMSTKVEVKPWIGLQGGLPGATYMLRSCMDKQTILYLYLYRHPSGTARHLKQDKHFDFLGSVEPPVLLQYLIDSNHDQLDKAWIGFAMRNQLNRLRPIPEYWTGLSHRRYNRQQLNFHRSKRQYCCNMGMYRITVWTRNPMGPYTCSTSFRHTGIGVLPGSSPETKSWCLFIQNQLDNAKNAEKS